MSKKCLPKRFNKDAEKLNVPKFRNFFAISWVAYYILNNAARYFLGKDEMATFSAALFGIAAAALSAVFLFKTVMRLYVTNIKYVIFVIYLISLFLPLAGGIFSLVILLFVIFESKRPIKTNE